MSGIHYVTDDQGERVAVQIDLREHGELWEDFSDVLVAEERENEPDESYEDYRTARLEKREPTGKA